MSDKKFFFQRLPDLKKYSEEKENTPNFHEKKTLDYVISRIKSVFSLLLEQKPRIVLEDGSTVDFKTGEIFINGDLKLHVKGNLYINSDKHIIINSGQKDEEYRKGYKYSIWLNSKLDRNGFPIKEEKDEQ